MAHSKMNQSQRSNKLPSERAFGSLFSAIFAGLCIYGLIRGWAGAASIMWAVASSLIAVVTLMCPARLAPFNRAWFLLGVWLNKIVSPVVLGFIFFGLLTPTAFVARLFGRDELRIKRLTQETYWIERVPPGPASDSFKNQF